MGNLNYPNNTAPAQLSAISQKINTPFRFYFPLGYLPEKQEITS
jgi:hypothetical protein